jgi:hypothetical protein
MVPASSSVTGIFKYTYKIPVYDIPLQLERINAQFRQISFTKISRRDTVSEISDKHMHSQHHLQKICSSFWTSN